MYNKISEPRFPHTFMRPPERCMKKTGSVRKRSHLRVPKNDSQLMRRELEGASVERFVCSRMNCSGCSLDRRSRKGSGMSVSSLNVSARSQAPAPLATDSTTGRIRANKKPSLTPPKRRLGKIIKRLTETGRTAKQ